MESLGSDMVASVNDGLAFSNFESSARFYLDLVLDSEMPEGTERDHRLLRKQQESIQQAYKAVYAACSADVPLPEAVGEIPAGTTLSDALSRIMANQIRVMNYFRTTVVGDKSIASFPDKFILVEDDAKFRAAITTNY